MVKLSGLAKLNATDVVIDFGEGESLNLVVYPNRLTLALEKELQKAQQDNDMGRTAELFFGVVGDWDLTDDEGKVLPRDEKTIEQIGLVLVAKILTDVTEACVPKELSGTSLKGGSGPRKLQKLNSNRGVA